MSNPILEKLGIVEDHERFNAAIRAAAAALPALPPTANRTTSLTVPGPSSPTRSLQCLKCSGTGRFRGYSGRDLGECYTCRGTGSSYIRPSETIATKPYPNILAAFARVERTGMKRASLRIGDVSIAHAGPASRNPGALYVKWNGEYVGKLERDKALVLSHKFHSPKTALAALDRIEIDPLAAIVAQAKTDAERVREAVAAGLEPHVACCCCGADLSDPVSRERGIGPICAARWGVFGLSMPEALALDDL